jgi:zinc transport system substrate-binding protein
LTLRPQRGPGCAHDGAKASSHDHHDHCDHTKNPLIDPHAWLDIDNTILMVRAIAIALAAEDRDNATLYHNNADNLQQKLNQLRKDLHQASQPLKHLSFVAFHDAYGYLEQRYGIRNQAAEIINQTGHLSLKAMTKIRDLLKQGDVHCLVVEPQHTPEMVQKLALQFKVPVCRLDPLGLEIAASPEHYFIMMNHIMTQLQGCQQNHAPKQPS